jgi:hypothetical protein
LQKIAENGGNLEGFCWILWLFGNFCDFSLIFADFIVGRRFGIFSPIISSPSALGFNFVNNRFAAPFYIKALLPDG